MLFKHSTHQQTTYIAYIYARKVFLRAPFVPIANTQRLNITIISNQIKRSKRLMWNVYAAKSNQIKINYFFSLDLRVFVPRFRVEWSWDWIGVLFQLTVGRNILYAGLTLAAAPSMDGGEWKIFHTKIYEINILKTEWSENINLRF